MFPLKNIRRRPNALASGTDSSVFGKSQASQLRSQQSQQSFSQGLSSQLSQNSFDENPLNDQRFGSQERENSAKRISCLAPTSSYVREENQMPISRSSNNFMHRWNSAPPASSDHRCQVSEELEHRIGVIETSINRFGRILDSVQSDVMQVNKSIKEVSLETEGVKQKLVAQDTSLQLMLKAEEDMKASLDGSLRSIPDQIREDLRQYKLQETISAIETLPDQIEARLVKLQSEICGAFTKEMKAITSSLGPSNNKDLGRDYHLIPSPNKQPLMGNIAGGARAYTRKTLTPKVKVEKRLLLKYEPVSLSSRHSNIKQKVKEVPVIELDRGCRVIIESDEDIDEGFACLLQDKKTEGARSSVSDEINGEAQRILKKARRRKRKHCNTIIIN